MKNLKFSGIITVILLSLFLTSCEEKKYTSDYVKDNKINPLEFRNTNAEKKLLILAKASEYKAKVIETVVRILRPSYSITIDDLDNIQEYNFTQYTNVVLMEARMGGRFNQVQSYLSGYTGVNNIFVFGTTGTTDQGPSANIIKDISADSITCASKLVSSNENAYALVRKIRQKGR